MATSLANYTKNRDNNFNLIRFIAASLVLFSHSFALTLGSRDFEPMTLSLGMNWGDIAVDIFFVSSGFLITSSFFNRNNLFAFIWARLLRIYPALIVAVGFCVFVVGLFFTSYGAVDYLTDKQTIKFLVKNTILVMDVEYRLPGVFVSNPHAEGVNGSLWTLPTELKMYGLLATFLVAIAFINQRIRAFSAKNVMLLIAIDAVVLQLVNHFHPILPGYFIRLFSLFFVGATFWLWRNQLTVTHRWIGMTIPFLLVSAFNQDLFFVVYTLCLPFIIFYLAYVPKGKIRQFNQFGDYSYGVYIYAFPVQQSLIAFMPNLSVTGMIMGSFAITLVLAMLSWHLIEKRALKMKNAYVQIQAFGQARMRYLMGQ